MQVVEYQFNRWYPMKPTHRSEDTRGATYSRWLKMGAKIEKPLCSILKIFNCYMGLGHISLESPQLTLNRLGLCMHSYKQVLWEYSWTRLDLLLAGSNIYLCFWNQVLNLRLWSICMQLTFHLAATLSIISGVNNMCFKAWKCINLQLIQ